MDFELCRSEQNMPSREKVVASILRLAHQIAQHNEFAHDAALFADMVKESGDDDGAVLLRSMAMVRRTQVVRMRSLMTKLAGALADVPIEAD